MAITITQKDPVPRDAKKREALDKIRMLRGEPPHNDPGNICYGDGIFATSIVRDYGPAAGATDIEGIKRWAVS